MSDAQSKGACGPVGHPRSLPPRPKPRCTSPASSMGKGAAGRSGPTIEGRDLRNVSVRMGAGGRGELKTGDAVAMGVIDSGEERTSPSLSQHHLNPSERS